MTARVQKLDPDALATSDLTDAVELLRAGRIVAFPTETVYGVGANAMDAQAAGRIFEAKGRPATNPVIVHVSDVAGVLEVAADWPVVADRLAEIFWPGPLTLVLPKHSAVPDIVTAGGPTVAVRIPAHPVALALLRAAKMPIAAPSANRSTQLSPTRAEHVLRQLGDRIDLILDAGATSGGIESTVLDITSNPPRLLRPGLISREKIEAVLGPILVGPGHATAISPARSPGQLERHYAPRTPLELHPGGVDYVDRLVRQGKKVGWLTFAVAGPAGVEVRTMPKDFTGYAHALYQVLHELDRLSLDCIVVDPPPENSAWAAIHDRLRRAATAPQAPR